MRRGGAVPVGELRHHCATSDDALYIIGVWDSDESVRARWASADFKDLLASVGFPPTPTVMTVLELHAIATPAGVAKCHECERRPICLTIGRMASCMPSAPRRAPLPALDTAMARCP